MVLSLATRPALAGGRLASQRRAVLAKPAALQSRSFYTVLEKYYESYKRFGVKGTLWKLYNPGDVKFGRLVGEDEFGHKYFEDPTEVYGQHRWTEFHVDSWEEVEGTLIPPQWHLWMHHLTDATPGQPAQDVRAAAACLGVHGRSDASLTPSAVLVPCV
jgi:NADH:ubiquinone oxidoreductase subunit